MGWFHARRSAIAFDLGAAGVRAEQFERRGRQVRLCDALRVERVPAAAAEADAGGRPPAPRVDVAQLRRLIGQGRFAGRDVALVLSPPEAQFLPLQLPEAALDQPPARLEQALRWEVARQCRDSAGDWEVRHWRLPRGHGQQPNVMAVAVAAETARSLCRDFERGGLRLRRIDVAPCALAHLAGRLHRPADSDLWGVLDLGLRHATLTVIVGRIPAYVRGLTVCAHQWTQQIAAAFQVPYGVAEELKRRHGVQAVSRGLGAPAGDRNPLRAADLPSAVASVLREPLRAMAQEAGRCFSYMMQTFPEHAVRHLLLAGGGAGLPGLAAMLAAELGIPVEPLAGPGPEGGGALPGGAPVDPLAAAALGAALLDLEAA